MAIETHDVLPPYPEISSPWQGVEPRTPWNVTVMPPAAATGDD
jgi:hypothetical protein